MPEAVAEPTFKAIVEAGELETFLDALDAFDIGEAKVHADENGLESTAVEPANVGMVETWLETEAFESYEASGKTLGLNLDRMKQVLGFYDGAELVELALDPETRKLTVGGDHRTFELALIDPDAIRQEPDIPDLSEDLNARATVEGRDLDDDIKAADLLSDHLTFSGYGDPARMLVSASGDTDEVETVYHEGDTISLDIPDGSDVSSLLSVGYCKDLAKPIPADAEVRVWFGEDFPVRFAYDFEHGAAVYHVAPRIRSESIS